MIWVDVGTYVEAVRRFCRESGWVANVVAEDMVFGAKGRPDLEHPGCVVHASFPAESPRLWAEIRVRPGGDHAWEIPVNVGPESNGKR
jgi:hypothetical protein